MSRSTRSRRHLSEIADIARVSEVYSVTGDWALVALVRVRAHEEIADVMTGEIDLDRLWGVGFPESEGM
ncbi:MAG: Lrp/AsnC ligand binding domain-containing protein [Egibacteraceae bacterium]